MTEANHLTAWHGIAVLAVLVQMLVGLALGLAAFSFKSSIGGLRESLSAAVTRFEKSIETLFTRQREQGQTLAELQGEHNSQMRTGGCQAKVARSTDPPDYDPSGQRCHGGERGS